MIFIHITPIILDEAQHWIVCKVDTSRFYAKQWWRKTKLLKEKNCIEEQNSWQDNWPAISLLLSLFCQICVTVYRAKDPCKGERKCESSRKTACHHLLQQRPCEQMKWWQRYIHLHQMLGEHPRYPCYVSQSHACCPVWTAPNGPLHWECVPAGDNNIHCKLSKPADMCLVFS